ncbi:MAG: hypothetical protein ACTS5I_07800 [Rhodanobacter sp.]
MHRPALPLFVRLRRHRGLWLLAIAVLMFKLVAGTVCLGDSPEPSFVVSTTSALGLDVAVAKTLVPPPDCLFGELGDCHCTCAHSMTLPSVALSSVTVVLIQFSSPLIRQGYFPAMTGSQLRPPIA